MMKKKKSARDGRTEVGVMKENKKNQDPVMHSLPMMNVIKHHVLQTHKNKKNVNK